MANGNGMPAAGMTALALQNRELLQTLAASPINARQAEVEGHMTLRTKIVEDDDPISKIVAAKTAAILNGRKSPEISDEAGVSRKPRKGTPVKLCHTPLTKGLPNEGSPVSRQVFPEMSTSYETALTTSSFHDNSPKGGNSTEDLTKATNGTMKDAGNFNIGTMRIPIHKPSKESPRAMLKSSSNPSPSLPTVTQPDEKNTEDIIEAVANSNAQQTLAKVETLRLNDKQYEIVPLGNKQWITRNEYEIMKELYAVQNPSVFTRQKSVAALKVPVFTVTKDSDEKTASSNIFEKQFAPKRTIDDAENCNNEDGENSSKKQKKDIEDRNQTTSEQRDLQDESDEMVIDTDAAQEEFKEIQGQEYISAEYEENKKAKEDSGKFVEKKCKGIEAEASSTSEKDDSADKGKENKEKDRK